MFLACSPQPCCCFDRGLAVTCLLARAMKAAWCCFNTSSLHPTAGVPLPTPSLRSGLRFELGLGGHLPLRVNIPTSTACAANAAQNAVSLHSTCSCVHLARRPPQLPCARGLASIRLRPPNAQPHGCWLSGRMSRSIYLPPFLPSLPGSAPPFCFASEARQAPRGVGGPAAPDLAAQQLPNAEQLASRTLCLGQGLGAWR